MTGIRSPLIGRITSNGAPFGFPNGLFGTRKDVESMTCHELLMLLRQWTHEVGLVERCCASM